MWPPWWYMWIMGDLISFFFKPKFNEDSNETTSELLAC